VTAVPDVLTTARSLFDVIDREAATGDDGRTMPAPVVSALVDSGLFELMVPSSMGGLEADAVTTLEVFEELSRADGSTGWSFLANATTTAFAAAYTGDAAVKEMFGGARPVMHAGMLGPRGVATPADGGYVVRGRYSFGSGCAHAQWIGAGTVVPGDPPELRVAFLPRDRVTFLDNWDVLGLSGTGSFDYEVPEQFVDAAFTFPIVTAVAQRGGPVYRLGVLGLTSIGHCGFALGVGRRALEEVARLAGTKVRMGATTPIGEQQMFQYDFAYQDAALRSARAYSLEVFGAAQATVDGGDPPTMEQLLRIRQATTYATRIAAEATRVAYTWAATDAIRPTPLQRCFRDIHTATQHIFVDNSTFTNATPVLLPGYL